MLGVFKEQLRELCGWNRVNKDGEGGMADSTEAGTGGTAEKRQKCMLHLQGLMG